MLSVSSCLCLPRQRHDREQAQCLREQLGCVIDGEEYACEFWQTFVACVPHDPVSGAETLRISVFDIGDVYWFPHASEVRVERIAPLLAVRVSGPCAGRWHSALWEMVSRQRILMRVGALRIDYLTQKGGNEDALGVALVEEDWSCPICLDDSAGAKIRTKCCGKTAHEACMVETWVRTRMICPLCRCAKCPFSEEG